MYSSYDGFVQWFATLSRRKKAFVLAAIQYKESPFDYISRCGDFKDGAQTTDFTLEYNPEKAERIVWYCRFMKWRVGRLRKLQGHRK